MKVYISRSKSLHLILFLSFLVVSHKAFAEFPLKQVLGENWVSATDVKLVKPSGVWRKTSFRYAASEHLQTSESGAALTHNFKGTGVAIRFGMHAVPAYGSPSAGTVRVIIDGQLIQSIHPLSTGREIVLSRNLSKGEHQVRIEHVSKDGTGCRVEGFRTLPSNTGELEFVLTGQENAFFVDARAILRREGKIIRSVLVRNWLTGQCSLTGLPSGDNYSLELIAAGWNAWTQNSIEIKSNQTTTLSPIYLHRDPSTLPRSFRTPGLGHPAIHKPGESFRFRFNAYKSELGKVTLTRSVGPARITRIAESKEIESAAFYYDREVEVIVPKSTPPGLYDISINTVRNGRPGIARAPRSLFVVEEFPKDPVIVSWGHLDTQGQYQAEYLQELAKIVNLLSPDIVLCATCVNPAYISGALSQMQVPYLTNYGNHQFYGHERWYGEPISLIDYGPNISFINFGLPWHVGSEKADALFATRPNAKLKIINSFEHNAPVESFLDKHKVALIHEAHGPGKRVMEIGKTPTQRVGKENAESFRVIRFKDNRVVSCTYKNSETAPIPFPRKESPPLSVNYAKPNDGTSTTNRVVISNRLEESFPNASLTFVMPYGTYQISDGKIESQVQSDAKRFTLVKIRFDIPQKSNISLDVELLK